MHILEAPIDGIDFFDLRLFTDLAASCSFTKTASNLGLTQSAVSRHVQRLEDQLGARLFERTTRSVRLNEAGEFFLKETKRLTSAWSASVQQLRNSYIDGPKRIRFAVSETVAFSYLPGFFSGYQNAHPADQIELSQLPAKEIITGIQSRQTDIGVVTDRGAAFPSEVEAVYQFSDRFVGISPPESEIENPDQLFSSDQIHLKSGSAISDILLDYLRSKNADLMFNLEAHSFDFIINLVSLGFGSAIVPQRALALYGKRKPVQRIPLPDRFERKLAVIVRRDHQRPNHLREFLTRIHF